MAKQEKPRRDQRQAAMLEFVLPPDEERKALQSQRLWLLEVARKIEDEEPLSRLDRSAAAQCVRRAAARVPETMPLKAGRAPAFDHAGAALEYVTALTKGEKKTRALARLAEKYDVTVEAMAKVLDANAPAAAAFLAACGTSDSEKQGIKKEK